MTPKTKQHLSHAKRDIAAGTASFRSAANHIAAAIQVGATQAEAARAVGKSQPWVNRLLKWREGGFKEDGPFHADHARVIISAANNPPTRTLPVTDRTAPTRDGFHHVEEQRKWNADGTPFDGLRHVVPYVTRDPELKKPKRVSVVTVSDPNPEQKPKRVSVVTVSNPEPEQK
jgi:hypothetical protein